MVDPQESRWCDYFNSIEYDIINDRDQQGGNYEDPRLAQIYCNLLLEEQNLKGSEQEAPTTRLINRGKEIETYAADIVDPQEDRWHNYFESMVNGIINDRVQQGGNYEDQRLPKIDDYLLSEGPNQKGSTSSAIDYFRLTSFQEVDNSFLTPWNRKPASNKQDIARREDEYSAREPPRMKFEPGSFFAYEYHEVFQPPKR